MRARGRGSAAIWLGGLGALLALAAARAQTLPPELDPSVLLDRLIEDRLHCKIDWREPVLSWSPPVLRLAGFRVANPGDEPAAAPIVDAETAAVPLDVAALSEGRLAFDPLTVAAARIRVAPDLTLELRNLRARASTTGANAPIDYALQADSASGGSFTASGQSVEAGSGGGKLEVTRLELAPFAKQIPRITSLVGQATGSFEWRGSAETADRAALSLELAGLKAKLRDIAIDGPATLRADLAPLWAGTGNGKFDLDTTRARMRYGEAFEKTAGTPSRVEGTLVRAKSGAVEIGELRVRVGERAKSP